MTLTLTEIVVGLLHLVVAPLSAGHALLYKRDSRSALGWVSACLVFPLVGPFLYFLFGVNRVRSRAYALSNPDESRQLFRSERSAGMRSDIDSHLSQTGPLAALRTLSDSLVGFPLVGDNEVRVLINGEEAYPAMLDAINGATRSVYLMTYILETNRTGREFIDALQAAKKRGVTVVVLVDGLGEFYSWPRAVRLLKSAGISVGRFLPPSLLPPTLHINLRNHRKLLIADDTIAFAGGMNIGDRHLVDDPNNRNPTQDVHFRFRGPILRQLYDVFQDSLDFVSRDTLPTFAGASDTTGRALCRAIIDGPDENLDSIELIIIGAISSAQSCVRLMTPYFLPSREMIAALKTASLKGVEVTIVLPSRSNLLYVQWATQNLIGDLLAFGIVITRQPPPFSHAKLLLIDTEFALIGSANIDPRSLRLNFELGVEIYDGDTITRLTGYFDDARARSKDYQIQELEQRSLPARLRDAFCWLFSPYL